MILKRLWDAGVYFLVREGLGLEDDEGLTILDDGLDGLGGFLCLF